MHLLFFADIFPVSAAANAGFPGEFDWLAAMIEDKDSHRALSTAKWTQPQLDIAKQKVVSLVKGWFKFMCKKS